MWPNTSVSTASVGATDETKSEVGEAWREDAFDARSHPLYPSFDQHLAAHHGWDILNDLDARVRGFVQTWRRVHSGVYGVARKQLGEDSPNDVRAVADSVLADLLARVQGNPTGLTVSYEPEHTEVDDGIRWYLRLGSRNTSLVDHPRRLERIVHVHQELVDRVVDSQGIERLRASYKEMTMKMREFRGSLTPDALLRKLIAEGQCDLCP